MLSTVNNKNMVVTLRDVWYVPNISKNLFSILAAQDLNENSTFESTPTKCRLKVNGKIVLCGSRDVGGTLFRADIRPITINQDAKVNVALADDSLLQLYHERWGHQDKRHIKDMLARELGIKVTLNRDLCEPCIYGKAHRLPFGTRKKASKPGELVSADVVGPFHESFSKKRYYVEFIDSFTKFRYGFLLKEKSQVKDVIVQMITNAKQQGHSVKELLTDGGGEFDNAKVRSILAEHGITQRLTAPYTPEQNGGSERDNRTVIEMARTFKYSNPEIKYPEAIWAELVTSAVYILNRTGKSMVEGKSPYELWMGKKPRIKHLRTISATCFLHVPSQKRRKMDEKAIKGYLIGYDGDERYRIYIKENNLVLTSRDVQFLEKPGKCEEEPVLQLKSFNKNSCEEPVELREIHKEDGEYEKSVTSEEEGSDTEMHITSTKSLRDRTTLKLPERFKDFVMATEGIINSIKEPESFNEAVESKDSAEWMKAMKSEMASLEENKTWVLSELPQGDKALPCKWVYRLKMNPDGTIDKYKARLVVKGYAQCYGTDYSQTFSPVAKMGTIRSILSIAASENLHLQQFDVSTAFLYGRLEENIYITQPEGYGDGTSRVCHLKKSLYGLKQAPRCWYKRFGDFLLSLGFKQSEADPCLYIRIKNGKRVILVLYVDDGLVGADDPKELELFLNDLRSEFKIVSKQASFFLGLEIQQTAIGIQVSQNAYAKKILERFNFSECKPVSTPMLKNAEISESGKERLEGINFPYRQAVGALMYLMLGTRPDLAYSIGFLSRSLENPSKEDVLRVKRVFRYISGTMKLAISYKRNYKMGILECYSDADFGGCTRTGRSTTGVVTMYAGGVVSWLSQRQATVSTSTTEAEIVAANEAAKEVIWLSRLFGGITKLSHVPYLQVDNSAAVRLAQNPEFHRRTKHIAMKHFFIREKVMEGVIVVEQIPSEHQAADIMTKPLQATRLKILCDKMGLAD